MPMNLIRGNAFSFKEKCCYLRPPPKKKKKKNYKGERNIHRIRTLVPANVCFNETKQYNRESKLVFKGKINSD